MKHDRVPLTFSEFSDAALGGTVTMGLPVMTPLSPTTAKSTPKIMVCSGAPQILEKKYKCRQTGMTDLLSRVLLYNEGGGKGKWRGRGCLDSCLAETAYCCTFSKSNNTALVYQVLSSTCQPVASPD